MEMLGLDACGLSIFLNHTSYEIDFARSVRFRLDPALGQNDGGQRNHRAVREGQHLIHCAGAGDGGKVGRAVSAQHDEVGLLG
jgi:hypothetical protein